MTTTQLFFSIAGLYIGQTAILIMYINAKIDGVNGRLDSISKQVDLLVQYMIDHEGRISALEERTGGPAKRQQGGPTSL
jgi:hypothetical protein